MKTLNLYIARQLFVSTAVGVAVLTFVFLSGNLIKVFDLVARGLPPGAVVRFILYLLPVALGFTIPLAILCATVLVFSRLSADNEITAMRVLGVGLWEITAPGILLSVALSGLCLFLLITVKPRFLHRAYLLQKEQGSRNPEVFLTPGIVELPGYIMYIGSRNGKKLRDLDIYVLDQKGHVARDITARRGLIQVDEQRKVLKLALERAVICAVERRPDGSTRLRRVVGSRCTISLDYGSAFNQKPVTRRLKFMTLGGLLACIQVYAERGISTTPLNVELHTRLSMGLSPIAFLLMGIPFGIRTRRSETAAGLALALGLGLAFYGFIVLADTLKTESAYHPELFVWIPNVLYQVGGIMGLHRLARK